jgi:hypothetical protein
VQGPTHFGPFFALGVLCGTRRGVSDAFEALYALSDADVSSDSSVHLSSIHGSAWEIILRSSPMWRSWKSAKNLRIIGHLRDALSILGL